jgi:TonB family protein
MTGYRVSITAAILSVGVMLTPVHAQEPLDERVPKLYASAEYEEVLTLLGNTTGSEAQLYRALCFLALGRQPEAEKAVAGLVSDAPDFTVSTEEVPPRFVTLLTETRRERLPTILRQVFTEAREHYQAKTYAEALERFEQIVAITSQPDVRDVEEIADLRILAEGFIDLAKASSVPARSAPESPRATPAASAARPPAAASSAPSPGSPTAAPASSSTAPGVATTTPVTTTQPVAVRREIPPWPAEAGSVSAASAGAVRVQISSTGSVTSASMVKRIHPRYDLLVLAAARDWQYRPATLNGVPVASESVVEIRVNPSASAAR